MSAHPTSLIINGLGAVSAAGWSVRELMNVVVAGREIDTVTSPRSTGPREWDCRFRPVPAPPADKLPKHPRLRRVSNVTRFAMASALEALNGQTPEPGSLGLIVCLMNGCVAFTNRFYNEVIDQPALASPILFPETVFNAPASHVAACLGISGPVTTLIGEPSLIAEALCTADAWLTAGLVKHCLVIGAEEADWLSTEGVSYYDPRLVVGEGAGALLVSHSGAGPRVKSVAGPFAYHNSRARRDELKQMAESVHGSLLIDGAVGVDRFDKDEKAAWSKHSGETVSPLHLLGECMGSAGALQLVIGAALAATRQCDAVISMPGTNTAAYACVISA